MNNLYFSLFQLNGEQRANIMDAFVGCNSKKTIEERLTCFLEYNKYHLPMFARPGMF